METDLSNIEKEIYMRCLRTTPPNVYEKIKEFEIKPDDILLSGGAKTGTTWMQQILHGLRSHGHMDFGDIIEVMPFLEFVAIGFLSVEDAEKFQPRMFKTHAEYDECPKANKIIVITRNPADAVLSLYHFYVNWLFTKEELSLEGFVDMFVAHNHEDHAMILNAAALRHLVSWYPHRKDENVLWLHYEDLKADLNKCIKLISDFTEIGVGNKELLDLVEHQASLDFMRQHRYRFVLEKTRYTQNELVGRDKDAIIDETNDGCRVREGKVNASKEAFSPETIEKLSKKWTEIAKSVTGFDSYEEMRAAVNEELGRNFPA